MKQEQERVTKQAFGELFNAFRNEFDKTLYHMRTSIMFLSRDEINRKCHTLFEMTSHQVILHVRYIKIFFNSYF